MFLFILGMIIILAGLVISFVLPDEVPMPVRWLLRMLAPVIGAVLIIISTAIYVEDDQAGVVVVKFGQDLPTGQIIATNGEKGPQAAVLPPGWHFGYWPWQYELTAVDNITIPQGAVGVVEAKDGSLPLPKGEIFASEWDSSSDMLDGNKFMAKGHKGPQLTVLTPGQYRYIARTACVGPSTKPSARYRISPEGSSAPRSRRPLLACTSVATFQTPPPRPSTNRRRKRRLACAEA